MADIRKSVDQFLALFNGLRLVKQQDLRDIMATLFGRARYSLGEAFTPIPLTSGLKTKLVGIDTIEEERFGMSVWDTVADKFTPEFLGVDYLLRLTLDVDPPSAGGRFQVELDIPTDPEIRIYNSTFETKDGTRRIFVAVIPIYCLDDFLANGAEIYITAESAGFSIEGADLIVWPL